MGHGFPDWGGAAPLSTVYSIQDLAELAARLGSPVIFDRRGNVLFIEDFKGSLSKCATELYGAGSSASIVSGFSRGGDFSCKLLTAATTDRYALVRGRLAYPALSKLAVEACWYIATGAVDLDVELWLYTGTAVYIARVSYNPSSNVWYYYDYDSTWKELTGEVYYYQDETSFNFVKLVIDANTKKHVRLIVNETTWDMSDKAIYFSASTDAPHLVWIVRATATSNEAQIVYVDSVIVTQNEP